MEKFDGVDVDLALSELLRNKLTSLSSGSIRFTNALDLQWMNKQAIQRVYQTSALIGRFPDLFDPNVGGQAVWLYVKSKTGKFYDEFLIKDVVHFHTRPGLHLDYFMVTITIPLRISTVNQIIHLTESTSYNRVSQQLTAGCHFLGASIVTFYVIARLNSGEITIEEARSIYATMIPELLKEHQEVENSSDMQSVPTPLTDTLEKYIFDKVNSKLSLLFSERRPVRPITQSEIMMTERRVSFRSPTAATSPTIATPIVPTIRPINAAISGGGMLRPNFSGGRPSDAAMLGRGS